MGCWVGGTQQPTTTARASAPQLHRASRRASASSSPHPRPRRSLGGSGALAGRSLPQGDDLQTTDVRRLSMIKLYRQVHTNTQPKLYMRMVMDSYEGGEAL